MRLAAIAVLLLAGCSGGLSASYDVDASLLIPESGGCMVHWARSDLPITVAANKLDFNLDVVEAAVDTWEPYMLLLPKRQAALVTIKRDPTLVKRGRARMSYGRGCVLGRVDVLVAPDVSAHILKPLLVHELGHALGLGHDRYLRESVMYTSIHNTHQRPTDHDRFLLEALYD